jgi:hypothetical protein
MVFMPSSVEPVEAGMVLFGFSVRVWFSTIESALLHEVAHLVAAELAPQLPGLTRRMATHRSGIRGT